MYLVFIEGDNVSTWPEDSLEALRNIVPRVFKHVHINFLESPCRFHVLSINIDFKVSFTSLQCSFENFGLLAFSRGGIVI